MKERISLLNKIVKRFSTSAKVSAFVVAVTAATVYVTWGASGATTIGLNISTGGTLTAGGLSTLDGGLLVNNSTSTIINLTTVNATSTNATTTTLYVSSLLNAGTTTLTQLAVVNVSTSTFAGGFAVQSAKFTVDKVTGNVGVGTSTPGTAFAAQGNALISGTTTAGGFFATGTVMATNLTTSGGISVVGASIFGNLLMITSGGFISSASSSVAANLNVTGPISASSTLSVNGLSTLAGGAIASASTSIASNLNVAGSLSASSTLSVNGASVFNGAVGIGTSTSGTRVGIQGGVYISGTTTAGGFFATGTVMATDLALTGNASTSGLAIWGQSTTTASNGFNVLGGCFAVKGTCVGGVTSLGGLSGSAQTFSATNNGFAILTITSAGTDHAFYVNGSTSPNFGFVSATSTIATSTFGGFVGIGTGTPSERFAVQGNALISGTTTVGGIYATGTIMATNLNTSGGIAIVGASSFTNLLTLAGGFISAASSSIVANLSVAGPLSASSTLSVGGITNLADLLTITGGGLISSASTSIAANLNVAGPLSASSTLSVSGATNLASLLTVAGFIASASSSVAANLSVAGPLSASSTLSVNGASVFNGAVGIGTSTSGTRVGIQGGVYISGTTTVGGFIATSSVFLAALGGNVGIGTTSPAYEFSVAKRSTAFNSGATSSLTAWATSTIPLPNTRNGFDAVYANGNIYTIAGCADEVSGYTTRDRVYISKVNSDGSLGPFATSSSLLPARRCLTRSVTANGFIYNVGGTYNAAVNDTDTVFYTRINRDGSLGAWATSTYKTPRKSEDHALITANNCMYMIGGYNEEAGVSSASVWSAPIHGNGDVGPWATTTNALPAVRFSEKAVAANGYAYVFGGADDTNVQNTVYSAKLGADCTTSAWSTLGTMPVARQYSYGYAANGYIYNVGGWNASLQRNVLSAQIRANGTLGPWVQDTPIPAARENGAAVMANGYLYLMGGVGPTGGRVSDIFIASTPRVLINGSLDLVGLASTSLSVGDQGSTIYAGNIVSTNNLEVAGNTMLWNGLNIAGGLVLNASTSLVQTGSIFSIQTATATAPLFNISYNGQISIGTSTPTNTNWNFQIVATRTTMTLTDAAAGSNLKHWSLSSQGGNFYFATSTDAGATSTIPAMMIDSNGNIGLGTTTASARLSIQGDCVDTGSGCADYAELYPASEKVNAGELLSLDPEKPGFVRRAKDGDPLIGAVSSNPAIVISGHDLQMLSGSHYQNNPDRPAVALAGRIPVMVNLEGGEIKVGDPVALSSVPGLGAKATKSGRIIGYALENFSGITPENKGLALVFLEIGYWSAAPGSDGVSTSSPLSASGSITLDIVKDWLQSLAVSIENGLVRIRDLFVSKLTAIPNSRIYLPSGKDQITGRSTMSAGMTTALVSNASVASTSKIFITPRAIVPAPFVVLEIKDGEGFTVGTAIPPQNNAPFDWFFINTYGVDGEDAILPAASPALDNRTSLSDSALSTATNTPLNNFVPINGTTATTSVAADSTSASAESAGPTADSAIQGVVNRNVSTDLDLSTATRTPLAAPIVESITDPTGDEVANSTSAPTPQLPSGSGVAPDETFGAASSTLTISGAAE